MVGGETPVPYSAEAPAPYRSAAKQAIAAEAKAGRAARTAKAPGELVAGHPDAGEFRQEQFRPDNPSEPAQTVAQAPKADVAGQVPAEAQVPLTPEAVSGKTPTPQQQARQRSYSELLAKLKGEGAPKTPEPVLGAPESIPGQPGAVPGAEPPQTGVALPEGGSSIVEPPGVPAEVPGAAVEPHISAGEPAVETSPLHQFMNPGMKNPGSLIKTEQGATGLNYRQAREAEGYRYVKGNWERNPDVPLGPTSGYARDSNLIAQGKAPEGPLAPPAAPVIPDSAAPREPWVQEGHDFLDRIKALGKDPSGSVDPAYAMKLAAPVAGAAIGAPVGASYDKRNPGSGALKGAILGGLIGAAGTSGPQALINLRNAGLLSGLAQVKKPLSDMGAYVGMMGEQAFSGPARNLWISPTGAATAGRMAKEALRLPTNFKNYGKGFMHPEITGDLLGDLPNLPQNRGLLGQVARPFAGAQNATVEAMMRSGISRAAAEKALFVAKPESQLGTDMLGLQKNLLARFLRPFARIGTNLVEQGIQRTPGLNIYAQKRFNFGNPDTLAARNIMGLGAMATGAGVGAMDKKLAAEGHPVSPAVKGLRRALMAAYGLPYTIAEAIAGSEPREIYYMIPGLSQVIPPPGPNETTESYVQKLGKDLLNQIVPAALKPDPGSVR